MSSRVLIQHLNGSRIDQEDTFQATEPVELTIGRERDCHIRYDQDRDDLVSRRHARLNLVPGEAGLQATLTDLHSANGLFANGARVVGTVVLAHGDLVRLGLEGPEFLFKLDPPPGGLARATRVISRHDTAPAADKATRIVTREDLAAAAPVPTPVSAPTPAPVRDQGGLPDGRRRLIVAAAAMAGVIGLSAGTYAFMQHGQTASAAPSRPATPTSAPPASPLVRPSEVVERYSRAVVLIRASWSLKDPVTQRALYHKVGPIKTADGKTAMVPYYIRKSDGRVLPWIVPDPLAADGSEQRAIGGVGQGTGFVATENGYVITNRHVAAHWLERFDGPAGALFQEVARGQTELVGPHDGRTVWVPGRDPVGGKSDVATITSRYEVQFENDETTVSADLVSTSDKHDVSVIRVNRPFALRRVEMKDTYDTVRRGDTVVVMGYPSVSGPGNVQVDKDKGNGRQTVAVRSFVTMSEGAVGNIHRPGTTASDGASVTQVNPLGDVYQLTINSTGPGNSGGPVFNDRGEVVAIFFAGRYQGGVQVSFAVPIRYALALLGDHTSR